ncbi:MAG: glutaredoxin family protein, partial [Myxococcales bacterium]|nr:glutaredoxin family protein [Myxococcales bacterium]
PPATEATPAEERAARAAAARAENARNEEARQAAELQSARARVPVVMYSTTWCGVCASARTYLDARRVRFTEYDVESNEAARAEHARLNPQRSVPTFDIGGEVLTGFSETAFEAALDAAAARRTP